MKLEDLRPKSVPFQVLGLDLEFRPVSIEDDLKQAEICGGRDNLVKAIENFDFEKISLLAWRQLTIESQRKIIESVKAYRGLDPETGEEIEEKLTPIQKFRTLFLGVGDQIILLNKLIECRGLNMPDIEDEEELKNWITNLLHDRESIGLKSSTRSQANTGGPGTNSPVTPSAN